MPMIKLNDAQLYYEEHGEGPEAILFVHGLMWSGRMFAPQVAALASRYRCMTLDLRGQGRSEVTAVGYDIDSLTRDAAALIDALACAPCHFVGLSMGGFIGMRLAIHRPELLRTLTLIESTAESEPAANVRRYALMNFVARWFGLRWVVDSVMDILFGQTFLTDPARAQERDALRREVLANDRIGITRAVKGVIGRDAVLDQLNRIDLPTLILVGEEDVATPPELSQRMQARIPGARLEIIPRAGHTSTLEEPAAVTQALTAFLLAEGT